MADKKYQHKDVPFSGKCIKAVDPALIGDSDFQELINLRYVNGSVRSVQGMTKVNSSVVNATNYVPTSGFHFNKSNGESHVLMQCANAGGTTSKVYDNTTTIPSTGNFTATELHTDSSGYGLGRFSDSPDDCIYYCNGADTKIYSGAETRVPAFITAGGRLGVTLDGTDKINNTLTDANNVITLETVEGGISLLTSVCLHFDGNLTDSSLSPHTVTANSGANFTATKAVFGTGSYYSGATQGYLTIPDHNDFNLSDAYQYFLIDTYIYVKSGKSADSTIYYQDSGAATDYIKFYVDTNYALKFEVVAASTPVVSIATPDNAVIKDTWCHVAVSEYNNDFYLYINGTMIVTNTDAQRAANYTGNVVIGRSEAAGAADGFYLDEFRILNGAGIFDSAGQTTDFLVEDFPYSTVGSRTDIWIGSLRPIKGAKFYIGTANSDTDVPTASAEAYFWDGISWRACSSVTDGTAIGGIPLKQTGSVTFTLAKTNEQPGYFHNQFLYWTRIIFNEVTYNVTVSHITIDCGFQSAVDIWDGSLRSISSFYIKTVSSGIPTYTDYTLNVYEDSYTTTDSTTYVELDSFATDSEIFLGFTEPMAGFIFNFIPTTFNTTPCYITISLWDGNSWKPHINFREIINVTTRAMDGTTIGAAPFARSGSLMITKTLSESKRAINSTWEGNDTQLFYYKISFSGVLSSDVQLYYVGGIPKQTILNGFRFPFQWQSRAWLCDEMAGERNLMLGSAANTAATFNGDGAVPLYIGDSKPITAATSLYSRVGTAIYEMAVITKLNETWMMAPENYTLFKVSDKVGCPAPLTMTLCNLGYEVSQGVNRHVAVWQSSTGIVVFDTNSILTISDDISNYFDRTKPECINSSYIHLSNGFFDEDENEYHWLFWSGSTPTLLEWVYSFKNKKWFQISRGTGKELRIGIPVKDTNGNPYVYGAIGTGYLERLEYGNTFDSGDIVSTVHFADKPLYNSMLYETRLRKIKLAFLSKTTTANDLAITHYADTNTTGTTVVAMDPTSATNRLRQIVRSVSLDATLHSLKFIMTTNDETIGFEPLYVSMFYHLLREDIAT